MMTQEEKTAKSNAYYWANRERVLANRKARYDSKKDDPEFREMVRASRRKANRVMRGTAGATGEAPRQGQCPLCKKDRRRLVCDHDRTTGRIRGWLCTLCNSFLGKTDDEAAAKASRILDYIKKAS